MVLRRNVLIFHAGALGDFVLTWPLALAMGRLFPQSRIIYVTHGQKGALAERVLKVESADIEGGWHHLHGRAEQLPPPAMKLLAGAHTILSYSAWPEESWTANVRRLAPDARLIALTPNPPAGFAAHATEHVLRQLNPWSAEQAAVGQILQSVRNAGIRYQQPTDVDVVIHPGSGSPKKCWPLERFTQLIDGLRSDGRSVRVLLGEAELERWDMPTIAQLERLAEARRPQTYVQLLDELARARLVIANDSGPAHLAGIIARPTLCLFGPTDPTVWRPLGPRVQVIQAPTLDAITVEQVRVSAMREFNSMMRSAATPSPPAGTDE